MSLFTPLIWILIIVPFIALAIFRSEKVNLKYLGLFVLYFLIDSYIQHLSKLYFDLDFLGLKFAWIGKILSLCFALIVVFSVSKKDREEIGFTTKTNSKSQMKSGILIFIVFLAFDFIFKMIWFPKGGDFDLEIFAFQMTMPGVTEELVFRGILFWLLDKAFEPKWDFKGVKFGWGFVIITILFAEAHGVMLTENYEFKFDIITILYLTVISSLSVGILRKLSGNLIFPILGHNAINTMNAIIRILQKPLIIQLQKTIFGAVFQLKIMQKISSNYFTQRIGEFDFEQFYTKQKRLMFHSLMWLSFAFLLFLSYRLAYQLTYFNSFILTLRMCVVNMIVFYIFFYLLLPKILKLSFGFATFYLIISFPLFVIVWLLSTYLFSIIYHNLGFEILDGELKGVITASASQTFWEAISFSRIISQAIIFISLLSPFFFVKILFEISKLYSRTIKIQNQKNLLEIQNINIEKDFLKSQLNPHFLFNLSSG